MQKWVALLAIYKANEVWNHNISIVCFCLAYPLHARLGYSPLFSCIELLIEARNACRQNLFLNEYKIKVSRACTHARTLQNSGFCFHNLHTYCCKTLGNKEIQIIYLHSFRKVSEKSRKSRKMGWKKRNIDNWEEVWMRGRKRDKSECCPQLSEIVEKT